MFYRILPLAAFLLLPVSAGASWLEGYVQSAPPGSVRGEVDSASASGLEFSFSDDGERLHISVKPSTGEGTKRLRQAYKSGLTVWLDVSCRQQKRRGFRFSPAAAGASFSSASLRSRAANSKVELIGFAGGSSSVDSQVQVKLSTGASVSLEASVSIKALVPYTGVTPEKIAVGFVSGSVMDTASSSSRRTSASTRSAMSGGDESGGQNMAGQGGPPGGGPGGGPGGNTGSGPGGGPGGNMGPSGGSGGPGGSGNGFSGGRPGNADSAGSEFSSSFENGSAGASIGSASSLSAMNLWMKVKLSGTETEN